MSAFQPIAKDPVHQKVIDALLTFIHRSGLKVGDKLPGERQLALELEVGRNSVRQGLLQLEEEGIIERMVGRGAFIRKEIDVDSIQLKLAKVNYQDLLEIKITIEQLAIRRAAERASDAQLAQLCEAAARLQAEADQGNFSIKLDHAFHNKLLECGGSDTLTQMVVSLIESLDGSTGILDDVKEIWLKTVPYHMDIALALQKRQVSWAIAAHEYIYRLDLEALNGFTEQQ